MQEVCCRLVSCFALWVERLELDLDFYQYENWNVDPFEIGQVPGKVRETKFLFVALTIRLQNRNFWFFPVGEHNPEFKFSMCIIHIFSRINPVLVTEFVFTCFSVLDLNLFDYSKSCPNIALGDLASESKNMSPLLLYKTFS